MASFCKQCSIANFGKDCCDMAGMVPQGQDRCYVLCEGCGPALVDVSGTCHNKNCIERHGDVSGFNREDHMRRLLDHAEGD